MAPGGKRKRKRKKQAVVDEEKGSFQLQRLSILS
jgi:hypothetical protein